uniref:NDUFA4 mitochondrial complex associated like 2 n=3 Tax=Sus scrofa TaxID=9823 RepID=A0A8D1K0N0_PIG
LGPQVPKDGGSVLSYADNLAYTQVVQQREAVTLCLVLFPLSTSSLSFPISFTPFSFSPSQPQASSDLLGWLPESRAGPQEEKGSRASGELERTRHWRGEMAGTTLGARFYRQIKRHPGLIPMIGFIGLGMGSAALYLLRLALRSPDVCWDRKNNPEPWNRLSPNDQYKFLAVSTDYKKLKKDRPDF